MTKMRIMIVEDEPMTAIGEQAMLRNLDYEVTGVYLSGEVAVERAGIDKPDLILMDIKLMGEMDGREAANKILVLHQIPVIYVTALGDKATSKSLKTTPPKDIGYIVKPFVQEELESEIKRLLG